MLHISIKSENTDKKYECKIHGIQFIIFLDPFGEFYCPTCYSEMIMKNCFPLTERGS